MAFWHRYIVFITFNGYYQYVGDDILTSHRSEAVEMSEASAQAWINYFHDNPIPGMISAGYEMV